MTKLKSIVDNLAKSFVVKARPYSYKVKEDVFYSYKFIAIPQYAPNYNDESSK